MDTDLSAIPTFPLDQLPLAVIETLDDPYRIPGHFSQSAIEHATVYYQLEDLENRLMPAQTVNEVITLEAKIKSLKQRKAALLDNARAVAIDKLLRGQCICLGYVKGCRMVIPPAHYSGELDWQKESLQFENRTCTKLRLFRPMRATQEQLELVHKLLKAPDEFNEETGPNVG